MSREARLYVLLAINLVLIVVQAFVGVTANSLGVLAAAGDYLADSGAVLIALLALWLARQPPTQRRPHGYPYAAAVASLVNAVMLGAYVVFVVVASVHRLLTGTQEVDGLPVLITSAVAALGMVIGAFVVGGDEERDDDSAADRANMRAVLLDTVADAAAAAGVAVAGAVILVTGGWYWLDPAVALVIAVVIGYHVVQLVRDVIADLRAGRSPHARALDA